MAEAPGAGGPTIRAYSMPGRKLRGEWRAAAIEVGTRSTCALTLNDPVVADRHCRFRAHAGGFAIEDLGSVTGTWHNGLAVASPMPLSSGDQVVIGVSRLTVELKQEGGEAALEIVVEEAGFHYKKPKPGEFHTDADEWVRSEVRFGKIAAVRGTVWLAGVAVVLLFAWVLAAPGGERFLQPGGMNGGHADPSKFHASCSACHARDLPGDVASCVACHSDMAGRHPFLTQAPEQEGRLAAAVAKPPDACRLCHADQHGGLTAEEVRAAAREVARDWPDASDLASGVCRKCHVEGLAEQASLLASVQKLSQELRDSAPPAVTAHTYAFEEFSHQAHAAKRKLACTVCHAAASAAGTAEFGPPKFAVCAACHVDWKGEPELAIPVELEGLPAAELAAVRAELKRSGLQKELAWHGTGKRCFDCHARSASGSPAPELATASRQVAAQTFRVVRTGHLQHVPEPPAPADCASCHGDLASLAPEPEGRELAFAHGSHVEELRPATDERKRELSEQRCAACHAAVAGSSSLDERAVVAVPETCSRCHLPAPGAPGTAAVTAVAGRRAADSVPKFSHAQHGGLAGGCFDCHGFGAEGGALAAPVLLAGVEDCSGCHAGHAKIAGDACAMCHKSAPFGRAAPVRRDWPSAAGFDHNASGHREYAFPAAGDATKGCAVCHDRPGKDGDARRVESATVVSEVPPPDARGWLCLDCHATDRNRFHWELPEAPRH